MIYDNIQLITGFDENDTIISENKRTAVDLVEVLIDQGADILTQMEIDKIKTELRSKM